LQTGSFDHTTRQGSAAAQSCQNQPPTFIHCRQCVR
jgi:hypothetical protein